MNIIVYDIEVFGSMFLFCGLDPQTGEMFSFELSFRSNELDSMAKFIENHKNYYFVGFNNVKYDSQVVEYILRHNSDWYDMTAQQILDRIKRFSNEIIEDQDYEAWSPYRERDLHFKQIDLFKIHHFDNKNRAASLKWIAFMIDSEDIEELPFEHYRSDLNGEELDKITEYCWKDIAVTQKFYLYTIGETEHKFYKGKNKIQDRLDIIEDLNFPPETLNFSDVKIGDEINKRGYCSIKGIDERQLREIRRKRGSTRKITFGECIPDYVTFQTEELQKFFEKIKPVRVKIGEGAKQEFKISFRGNIYVVARGGIHTLDKSRIVIPKDDEIVSDADVGGQHPRAIVKRKLYPDHLGPEWLVNYEVTVQRRDGLKVLIKEATDEKKKSRLSGQSDMLKLANNGGGFGKTIDKTNWQYGPEVGFGCTIGNQFEILMLAERFELVGIRVVSANTDGLLCIFKKDLLPEYERVCKEWEKTVGNTEMGKLEFARFSKICQESINHYIAVKEDGKLKVKGRFDTDCEVNKNNTKDLGRIERKAIVEYFSKGVPIEKTIMASRNIYDFVIGVKSSKDYHHETYRGDGSTEIYKRIIRFYISKEGVTLLKVKNEDSDSPGVSMSKIAGGNTIVVMNHMEVKPWEEYKIDYEYYINSAQVVVNKIEGRKTVDKNQLTLF